MGNIHSIIKCCSEWTVTNGLADEYQPTQFVCLLTKESDYNPRSLPDRTCIFQTSFQIAFRILHHPYNTCNKLCNGNWLLSLVSALQCRGCRVRLKVAWGLGPTTWCCHRKIMQEEKRIFLERDVARVLVWYLPNPSW